MNNRWKALLLTLVLLPGTYAIAHSANRPGKNEPQDQNRAAHQPLSASANGETRFHEHCGRCHNPPEDLSAREAKAVMRKMRVRAMLTAEDEKLILQYIAP